MRLPHRPTDVVMRRLEAEADKMWSFVKKKANKQWVWTAMDAITRQIIAFHVGDCSRDSAKALGAKIPLVYREQARSAEWRFLSLKRFVPGVRVCAGVLPRDPQEGKRRELQELAKTLFSSPIGTDLAV